MRLILDLSALFVLMSLMLPLPAMSAEAGDKGVEVILIIDSSGSMKKTDPSGLRIPAAKLFVSLLKENDSVGVVSFEGRAKVLTGPIDAGRQSSQKQLFSAIEFIHSSGAYTNLQDALVKGLNSFPQSANENKIIILMSDGQMDTGDKANDDNLNSDINSRLIPEFNKLGIKIYTISFTDMSDSVFLEDIARKTGGFHRIAHKDSDLHLVFSSIFEKIKSPDTLPVKEGAFTVDGNVHELTMLVTKKTPETSVVIVEPSGKEYSGWRHGPEMKWFESTLFDMVTVYRPAAGKWNIKFAQGEGNKVFIVTDLKLMSSLSKNFVEQGSEIKIEAWLLKDEEAVNSKEFSEHLRFEANVISGGIKKQDLVLKDDGLNSDSSAGDGIYTASFAADAAGDYTIKITSKAETFVREKEYAFRVMKKPETAAGPTETPVVQNNKENIQPVSWQFVLIRFGLINLAIALLIAGGYYIFRKKYGRRSKV